MIPHLLFITSTNLASNPRCRKEIDVALRLGYQVTYIAFDLPNWTREKEQQIKNELSNVDKIYIPAGRQDLFNWAVSSLSERLLRKIAGVLQSTSLISFAISRRSLLLVLTLKKLTTHPDLIIAHNSAAFFPAWYFSKAKSIPFAIDMEDYHAGEGNNKALKRLNTELVKKVLPSAEYISFASPLIQERIIADVSPERLTSDLVINNVFSETEFTSPIISAISTQKIQLVWFSQNIDRGRGLEEILPVIEDMQDHFELTLIGNIREQFYTTYLEGKKYIRTVPPLSQAALNKKLSDFDIGLALENSLDDENRDICLTNKIWSYYQSGLFIIASNTKAQKIFLQQYPQHGIIADLHNKKLLKDIFTGICRDRKFISSRKLARYEEAKAHCWEKEAEPLKMKWKEIVL